MKDRPKRVKRFSIIFYIISIGLVLLALISILIDVLKEI